MKATVTYTCCDPAASFPQVIGTVTFTNPGKASEAIRVEFTDADGVLTADPADLQVAPGESVTVTISAASCPSEVESMDVVQFTDEGNVLRRSAFRAVDAQRCDRVEPVAGLLQRFTGELSLLWLTGLATSFIGTVILHSALSVPAKATSTDATEILLRGIVLLTVNRAVLEALFGPLSVGTAGTPPEFPCGAGPNGFTVCPMIPSLMPVGDYLFVWLATNGTIPLASPTRTFQYGFVFDADGIAANNYVPPPAFANDFYGGTDRWYSVEYDPVGGWRLVVTDARSDASAVAPSAVHAITVVPSAARAIIVDNAIGLFVPKSEFAVDLPAYRVTAFEHGGDFGIPPPNDWSGDLSPTVAEGLATFPDED
jgi:hypothetical protein